MTQSSLEYDAFMPNIDNPHKPRNSCAIILETACFSLQVPYQLTADIVCKLS